MTNSGNQATSLSFLRDTSKIICDILQTLGSMLAWFAAIYHKDSTAVQLRLGWANMISCRGKSIRGSEPPSYPFWV